jgi:hypothetical protein
MSRIKNGTPRKLAKTRFRTANEINPPPAWQNTPITKKTTIFNKKWIGLK